MSKYTTEVRYICESFAGYEESQGGANVDEIVNKAAPMIFDNFPIYDEAYRATLMSKILRHYYTREIGVETVALWRLKLNTKMREIMPYFNMMYKVITQDYNPLYDVDLTRTRKGNVEQAGTESESSSTKTSTTGDNSSSSIGSDRTETTGASTSQQVNKISDTPQGGLTGLLNDQYMSGASIANNSSSDSGSTTSSSQVSNSGEFSSESEGEGSRNNQRNVNTTEDYIERVTGKQGSGSYARMVKEYYDSLVNVDMQIIDTLSDLFMNVW